MQRRLAAILVADVVGYSRLMGADEAGTLASLQDRTATIIEPQVAAHSGRIVKSLGDGVLVEFPSAVNAVGCALALQQGMAQANRELPEQRRILLRIGINLGDVMAEGADIYGDGVNIAARLEGIADPGGICLSAKVQEEVRGRLDCATEDLGELTLKNIALPVRAYRVLIDGVRRPPRSIGPTVAAKDRTRIAVLPFTNMSGSPEQDYFADGITEDIITELSRHRDLLVLARNTTFAYKGRALDIKTVARELGADFVVEGSTRQSGRRVRVTIQLIDGETGAHVLAEKFDREMEDIFAVQDEIVTAIVARFTFGLDVAAGEQRQRDPTTSSTAYAHFLQARAAWRNGRERDALDHLVKAAEIDPGYARALAYLGFFYSYSRFSLAAELDDAEAGRRAREYARRAIAAGGNDSFTLHRTAMNYLMLGDPAEARRCIDAAAALSPRELEVMQARGIILAFNGEHAEGLALIEAASRLEPTQPVGFHVALSDTRYLARDYRGALAALDRIPNLPPYLQLLRAAFLAQIGRADEAHRLVASVADRYDAARFARNCAGMCLLPADAEHWLEGFRKAGIAV